MLTVGHHNSLGRTVEVVDIVLSDTNKLNELYRCYFSTNEVVRLRTSNALKRISKKHPEWLIPYIDKFLNEISTIPQPSAQWTLADLFLSLSQHMSDEQQAEAKSILKHNLESSNDWIVLNNTMQTLAECARNDSELKQWLIPQLNRLSKDSRKSVAGRAKKLKAII